jgi:hypothetical protein
MKTKQIKATRQTINASAGHLKAGELVVAFGYIIQRIQSTAEVNPRADVWKVQHDQTDRIATSREGLIPAFFKCRKLVRAYCAEQGLTQVPQPK